MSDASSRHRKRDRSKKKSYDAESSGYLAGCEEIESSGNFQEKPAMDKNDTGIGLSEVAAEMFSSTASILLAPLEAIGELPSLAVANAIQGISRATSGLGLQQITLHTMIFGAVKRALELRQGVFSALPSPKPDTFNSLDADEVLVGIDEESDDSEANRNAASSSRRTSFCGDALKQNLHPGFFGQNHSLGASTFYEPPKKLSELQAALDLLKLLKDPPQLPPTTELLNLEKEVAKIRLVALDRGVAQANERLVQIIEKMKELELQKESLLSNIDEFGTFKEIIKERINTIDVRVHELQYDSNENDCNMPPSSSQPLQIEPTIDYGLEKSPVIIQPPDSTATLVQMQQLSNIQENTSKRSSPRLIPKDKKETPTVRFQEWKAHDLAATCLFQDMKGPILATASEEEIKLWQINNDTGLFSVQSCLASTQGTIHCLKIVDGILAAGGNDQVDIWNTRSLSFEATVESSDGEPNPTSPVAAPHPAIILKGHKGLIRCLDMDEVGLISGSMDGTMRHWDIESGKLISSFDSLWTMNNGVLNEHRMKYWDALAGRGPHVQALGSTVGALQFIGRRLSSGTADGIIRLWDTRTGQSHRSFVGHTGPVTALQFNDTHLVSGSLDHTVKIWDLRAGKVMETIKLSKGISSVQFDSQRVFAACDSKHIEVYERRTFQNRQLRGHSHPVWCLQLGQDRRLFSGDQSGDIRLSTL